MKRLLCVVLGTVCWLAANCRADLYVIVNAQNDLDTMATDEVGRLFLQKAKRFSNGESALPVAQAEGREERTFFNAKVLERDEQQLKYYWSRRMFAGGDKPPPVLPDDAAVTEFVAGQRGAIGYVGKPPTHKGVRTVLVITP